MSFLSLDFSSFFWGIALGVIGAFGAGFLKKAGEDFYAWLRNTISPVPQKHQPPQVVINVSHKDATTFLRDESPPTLTPTAIDRVSGLTFEDIRSALERAPPLQRDDVAKSYIGIRVEWETYYKGGSRSGNDLVSLRLTTDFNLPLNTIWCEVPLNDYRELGVLAEGAKIRVSGEIVEAGSWDIKLKNVRLDFLEAS